MEAPEKIYLEAIYPDNGVLPNGLNYTSSPTDIEYTRTDAFIEKTCEYFAPYIKDNSGGYDRARIIENFKKYMKGE